MNSVRFRRSLVAVLVMAVCAGAAACHHEAKPQARHYQLRGTVISVDSAEKQIVVDHEAIPGFMAAMTMPYTVKDDAALQQLTAGDRITARVVVTASGMWLDSIVIQKSNEPPRPEPTR